MKKILKYLGIIVLIVLVLLLAYIIYLFASYHRIPDNQPLQVEQTKESISSGDTLTTEKEYSALTYNIGFGAYTPDFSFFMDGGKSSWAKSKESVKKTVQSAGERTGWRVIFSSLILPGVTMWTSIQSSRKRFQVIIPYLHRIMIPLFSSTH